jgi:predicted GIY-YIG superfamily endonuclease
MNETDLNQTLEDREQFDDARGPGCYALAVDTPNAADDVARQWHRYHDHPPQKAFYARLADADTVLYVGAASDVYARLCDHVAGDVRKAAFLEAFPAESLHSLWPKDSAEVAFREEEAVARALANVNRRVWTDGKLL